MALVRINDVHFHSDGVGMAVAEFTFDTGEILKVDFAERVRNRPKLKPLLEANEFMAGKIVDDGIAIEWPCGIDMDAQSLYRTAHGMKLRTWRKQHGLNQAEAGEALGISGRSIQLYEAGDQPITKTVLLAMRGYDAGLLDAEPAAIG